MDDPYKLLPAEVIKSTIVTIIKCPYCSAINKIEQDNRIDETMQDIDGLECYSCKKVSPYDCWFEWVEVRNNKKELIYKTFMDSDSLDECYSEEGQKYEQM